MSKQNKSPKKRKKKMTFRPNSKDWGHKNSQNTRSMLGEALLQSTSLNESITIYETPFGKITAGEGADMKNLKNKGFLVDILGLESREEMQLLDQLIAFEKLKDKYPNEPYIYNEIAEIYRRMGEEEKFVKTVKKNYELFKDYFEIDLNYFEHIYKTEATEREGLKEKIFGTAMNLHQIYPKNKAFEKTTVYFFYSTMGTYFLNIEEYQMAKDCARVVKMIQPEASHKLDIMIKIKEDKIYRWKQAALIIGLLLLILAVIGGIIYGIVKFFQWIF